MGLEDKYDQVMDLINLGKKKGYLLYKEVHDLLPAEVHSSEEIEDLLTTFGTEGIEVIEESPKVAADRMEGSCATPDRVAEGVLDWPHDLFRRPPHSFPLCLRHQQRFNPG